MDIRENVLLADHTTFGVGGPARYFCRVKTIEELKSARAFAESKNCSIFILGDGSNVVVSSAGYSGLAINIAFDLLQVDGQIIRAGAGQKMSDVVNAAIESNLAGLEWAGGLPGTFGGAIRGNAGAFKGEIKDVVKYVTAYSTATGEIKIFNINGCQFGYRESYFKRHPSWVILESELLLEIGKTRELRAIADKHIEFRQTRHPLEYPNAGSIFKNVSVDAIPATTVERYKDFVKTDPLPVVPTGKIIEDAGLKGYRIGAAQVSEKHCNYIVNTGGATGEDIYRLVIKIKKVVAEKFGVALETEPEFLGFDF